MRAIAAEWVAKAEGDFAILERECRARKTPSFDGACFHAQQCAEKYLKARLCEAGISFSKIHDLVALLETALDVEPAWDTYRDQYSVSHQIRQGQANWVAYWHGAAGT